MKTVYIDPAVHEFMGNGDALSQQFMVFKNGGSVGHRDAIKFIELESLNEHDAEIYEDLSKRLLSQVHNCEQRYGVFGASIAAAAEGILEGLSEDLANMARRKRESK
jgi:hypothetical protein